MEFIIGGCIVVAFISLILFLAVIISSKNKEKPVTEFEYKEYLMFLKENSKNNKKDNDE